MRLLIEPEYSDAILTSDLTDNEACVIMRAFDKALVVKKEGWGADSKLIVQGDKELPAIRFVSTTSALIPVLGLREVAKETLADEAAKDTRLTIE